MADIKQKIIASDETSAAYASARKRVNDYSGAVRASSTQQREMGMKAMQSAESVNHLQGALNGNATAMARMAGGASKLIPGIAAIAGPVGVAIAAIAALKVAWTAFGLTTRMKSWFSGKPLDDIMSFSESVKKAADDYKASADRMRAARDAAFGKASAEIAVEEDQSPMNQKRLMAELQLKKEMAEIDEQAADAYQAMQEAAGGVDVANKAGGLIANEEQLKAIREAEAEFARKKADYAAAEEIQRTNAITALLKYKAAMQDVAKASAEANDALAAGEIARQIEQAGFEAKSAAEYIKMADDALAAVGKSKRLGDVLAGGLGDRGAAAGLKEKQNQLAMIDEQTRLIKARTDPGEKQRRRDEESARRSTERKIGMAEEWEKKGRPLSKWMKDILAEQEVLKFKEAERLREEAAKLAAQQLKDKQAQAALDKQARSLTNIERDLKRTLQAGG
jgi:hypothetical protein